MTEEIFSYSDEFYNEKSAENTLPVVLKHLPNIKNVIDFGCGNGTWLSVLKSKYNCDILGVDNQLFREDFLIDETEFKKTDITRSFSNEIVFDLAICLEVGEHIPTDKTDGLIRNLTDSSDHILFSAAIPYQGGVGHVNESWTDFWSNKFAKNNYFPLDIIRPLIWNNNKIKYYYRQNIVLFCKSDSKLFNKYKEIPELKRFNSYVHPELYNIKSEKADNWDNEVLLKSRTMRRKVTDFLRRKVHGFFLG